MWSRMKSLSFKLILFYVVSILIIVVVFVVLLERNQYQRDIHSALRQAEIGPGFINGATPDNSGFLMVSSSVNPDFVVKSADIANHMTRFKTFFDWSVPGGVSVGTTIDGPISINNQDYYNVTFKIRYMKGGQATTLLSPSDYDHIVGPITVPKMNFPATAATYTSHNRMTDLYYLTVPGHDNMIFVVSLDRYTVPITHWQQQVIPDLMNGLPVILIFSFIFALLLAWITTIPLKRITRATELLSHSDLSQRVKYKSGDEIGRLAQSFNTMADRLEESFISQKRFVSDAAHELRTPLASMKTSVTGALGSEKNTEDHQKLLEFMSGRIDHMESLVNDLLFLSRIDEDKYTQEETRLDLSQVLGESEEAFRYLFEDKDLSFSSEIEPELFVKGDRKLMLRVISNLLDNAAKNTPAGGRVYLQASAKDNNIVVSISDTGRGIPQEHIDHVFDRFYKVPGSPDENNGYGLGLAICKSIIVSSGGNISAKSEPGKESIFTIELPRVENREFT
jgi:two-component system, OmpR family, heavy metal sensor histidine kinase CusS